MCWEISLIQNEYSKKVNFFYAFINIWLFLISYSCIYSYIFMAGFNIQWYKQDMVIYHRGWEMVLLRNTFSRILLPVWFQVGVAYKKIYVRFQRWKWSSSNYDWKVCAGPQTQLQLTHVVADLQIHFVDVLQQLDLQLLCLSLDILSFSETWARHLHSYEVKCASFKIYRSLCGQI